MICADIVGTLREKRRGSPGFYFESPSKSTSIVGHTQIEHRLFSHITMNWRGRPLVSYEVIVNLIGATTTEKGLRVRAALDAECYPTKVKIKDEEQASVDLHPHHFHG